MKGNENTARRSHPNLPPLTVAVRGLTLISKISTSLQHLLLVAAVWSLVLSMWAVTNLPVQVVEAAACVTAPSGLVGWWPGDGSATDIEGGNDGTLLGGTFFSTSKVGAGFAFDTDDDRVSIAHHTNYDVQSPGFSVHFWVKGTKNQSQSLFDVVDKSHGWTDSTGWTFQGDSSTGLLSFAIGAGGAGNGNFISAQGPDVLDGTFHHFVGTWDGSTISVYVDGTLEATSAFSAPVNNEVTSIGV